MADRIAGFRPSVQGSADTVIASATKVVAASDSISTSRADYVCDGTADEVQINAAITAIASKGGAVVLLEGTYNIAADITIGASKISLIGANPEATILSFGGARQIIASGSYTGLEIAGLYLKGSTDTNGAIYFNGVSRSKIHNCYFSDNASSSGNAGSIKLNGSTDIQIFNNQFNEAGSNGAGILVNGSSHRFSISDNIFRGGASGLTFIDVGESGARSQYGQICDNKCYLDVASHRFLKSNDTGSFEMLVSGNLCYGTFTFCFDTNSANMYLIGNVLISTGTPASSEGMVCRSDSIMVGNVVKGTVPTYPLCVIGAGTVVHGNYGEVVYAAEDTKTIAMGNYGSDPMEERYVVKMKNTSGGQLVKGDVVVRKAVAAGNEFTTTTTGGDPKVVGMVLETIANDAFGYVLTKGKTVSLKVDGTTDIAIGDLLSTYTSAGIAKKASTGETAFAMALEAYTTDDSSGVIDALLIEPRVAI